MPRISALSLRSCFEFIAQSTHENGYIKPRKTFWRNSKQLLSMGRMFFIKCKLPMWIKILTFAHTFIYYNRNKKAV